MTFLNPAILFGLATASIPVIIHLLNLRKLKVIEFSTLDFLKELQKNKIRRVKLKQWLLLALRVLIILLIVTAFARPTLEGIKIGGTTSAAKTTALFLLDDTFSMSVIDQKGSHLNQAKQSIKYILQNMEEGDEVGLLLVSGDASGELNLTSNFQSFSEQLESIPVSGSTGTLNSVLIRAAGLISESKNFNKEMYLLTDFQSNRIALKENLIDLGQLLRQNVKLYTIDYSDRDINNISVDRLDIKTKIFEKNKAIIFKVILTNHSDQSVSNLVASLFMDTKRSAQKSIDFQPNESKEIFLEGTTDKPGFSDVFIEIEDDDILEDNKRYATVKIPERISVLVLYDDVSDANFVSLALQSSHSEDYLNVTLQSIDRITSTRWEEYNIVILIGSSASSKLLEFVSEGGGVVIFPSSNTNLEKFQSVFNSFKLPLPGPIVDNESESGYSADFERVDMEHPLLQNIFKDEEKTEIESPEIYKYFKILPKGRGRSVITLLDGSSFLSEYEFGKGKILVCNVSPVLEWSDFPVKSIFAPLVYKSAMYLSSGNNGATEILAGEPINFNTANKVSTQLKIFYPNKSEEFINVKDITSGFINFTKTYSTGNYKFYSDYVLLETFSVNIDPVESDVSYIQEAEFEEYLNEINFSGTHLKIPKDANPNEIILQSRFGSELWRYFLIAAFLLALIEMTVSRSAKKDMVELEK